MSLWYLLETRGLINIDRNKLYSQYKLHFSNAENFFSIEKLFPRAHNLLKSNLSIHKLDIVQDYLSNVLHTLTFGLLLYFIAATLSYIFFFKVHQQLYLPNFKGSSTMFFDIKLSVINILVETILVAIIRISQPRLSLIYYDINDYGILYLIISIFLHIIFDQTLTYWIHRWLHTYPDLYLKYHLYHHKSQDVTPFSGFAFHPLDAFAQALPTFLSCFFFPLHVNVLLFFSFITPIWAISIHDNVPLLPWKLFLYSTHHTIHHEPGLGKNTNYGQFTSVWDRLMGTYWDPDRIDFGWIEQQNRINSFSKLNSSYGSIVSDKSTIELSKRNQKGKNQDYITNENSSVEEVKKKQ